ncbi:MAG: HAD-IIIA family hydrolase [Bacteroidales bacterium]|nr:HAD-IIIA family hydrolase [Bacteroidales bacterium]
MKYIIWDLDGTLMDTLQDLADAVNYAMKQYNMPQHSIDAIRQYVGNGVRRLMVLAVPQGEQNPHFDDAFAAFRSYYMEHCKDHTCLYAGIAETLAQLRHEGYRMAVVSNKMQSGVDELYAQYFADTIEVAIGERPNVARKPAPDMVYAAMEALQARPEETVYIGDSDVDLSTARNSGLPCISVLWGFRDKDFLTAHGATHFAQSPADIASILKEIEN